MIGDLFEIAADLAEIGLGLHLARRHVLRALDDNAPVPTTTVEYIRAAAARLAALSAEMAELPDRTSSELNPDEMIVTADELAPIVAAALAGARQDQATRALQTVAGQIAAEIMGIMETYDSQMAESGYVDTPGGLEHMGDVWSL